MKKKLYLLIATTIIFWVNSLLVHATDSPLIKNPSFEEGGKGIVFDWSYWAFDMVNSTTNFSINQEHVYSGQKSILIENSERNDSRIHQNIVIEPNSIYKVSAYIKTENVTPGSLGAVISTFNQLNTSEPLTGTSNWTYREVFFISGRGCTNFSLTLGLGGYGSGSKGKAWFDNIKMSRVENLPEKCNTINLTCPSSENEINIHNLDLDQNIIKKTNTLATNIPLIFIILFLIISLMVSVFIFRKKIFKATEWLASFLLKKAELVPKKTTPILKHITPGLKIAYKWRFLIIIFFMTLLLYIFNIYPDISNNPTISPDAYRDVAYAQNILNGNSIFSDPAIKGEFIWYPPLTPLIMAGLHKITGLHLFTLYTRSVLVINFFIPILLYLFVMLIFNHPIAFISSLLIPIMPWLSTHLFQLGMPSIYAFTILLGIFSLTLFFEKKGMKQKYFIIIGILIGFSLLCHSLSGLILYASIMIYFLIQKIIQKKDISWVNIITIIALPFIMWSPYFLPNFFRAKLNPEPLEYVSNVLYDPNWNLYIPNIQLYILFWSFALIGCILLVRKWRENKLFLMIIIMITALAQASCYLHEYGKNAQGFFKIFEHLPYLIAHEFQWFFQIFILPAVASGMFFVFKRLTKKKWILLFLPLFIAFVFPGYSKFMEENKRKVFFKNTYSAPSFYNWVMTSTDSNDVFVVSNFYLNYFEFQPTTARKVLFTSEGYMNFNVDVKSREKAWKKFIKTADYDELMDISKHYEINYALIAKHDIEKNRLDFFKNYFSIVYQDNNHFIFKITSHEQKS
ncbi:MAG: glycosyltransferase family 39 protein [Spirochaetales bacterium]|nr:glycosyltransferase family 39 protein [Spirochaetales bacterium]